MEKIESSTEYKTGNDSEIDEFIQKAEQDA